MLNQKNILIIPKWYPSLNDIQNGVFVKKHAKTLAQQHKVTVLYISSLKNLDTKFKPVSSFEDNINETIIYFKKSNKIINAIRYYRAFIKGYSSLNQTFDLTIATILTRPLLLAYILKLKHNTPITIWEHWTGYQDGGYQNRSFFIKYINQFLVAKADNILCVSEPLVKSMKKWLKHTSYNVVPNVVENNNIERVNKNSPDKKIILTVADLSDFHKNISGSINAIKSISKIRTDFEFHIIGGGNDYSKFEALATKEGLLNNLIFFKGKQSNSYVLEYISNASFVLINSNFETFSVFAIEALLNGKPIVSTISGGPEEFITKETGILIEKNDSKQLEEAINFMLDNYSTYKSETLKESVTKFSPNEVLKAFNKVHGY